MHSDGSNFPSIVRDGNYSQNLITLKDGFRHVEEFLWSPYANVIFFFRVPHENMLEKKMASLCDDGRNPFKELNWELTPFPYKCLLIMRWFSSCAAAIKNCQGTWSCCESRLWRIRRRRRSARSLVIPLMNMQIGLIKKWDKLETINTFRKTSCFCLLRRNPSRSPCNICP